MHKILTEISSKDQLYSAWHHVKKKYKTTPGIDGESIEAFEQNWRSNLKKIGSDLKNGEYKFQKVRETQIPKKKGSLEKRPIRIYCVRDKIVQTSLRISIEKERKKNSNLFPEINNSVSIGFLSRNHKGEAPGVQMAVKRIKAYYKQGYKYLVSADIKDFFEVIDKSKLSKIIMSRLGVDDEMKKLIHECLHPEVIKIDRYSQDENLLPKTVSGVAQGSVLSPLFSNIYLMDFDKMLESEGIVAIRYADDIAILAHGRNHAKKQLKRVIQILSETVNLDFHPVGSKKQPKIMSLTEGAEYLGITFVRLHGNNRWSISPSPKKVLDQEEKIIEMLSPSEKTTLYDRVNRLNSSIQSWFSTYQYAGCTKRNLSKLYKQFTERYTSNLNHLLRERKIVTKPLDQAQLDFLGILPPKIRRNKSVRSRR